MCCNGPMTDDRCKLMMGAVDERAIRMMSEIDADRALRLVLASLKDDEDGRSALLERELGDCPQCLRGMVVTMAGMYAADLDDPENGGVNQAIRRVEWTISQGIENRLSGDGPGDI